MGLKEWILVITIAITLLISIPVIISNHKTIKEIEKYYEKRSGIKKNDNQAP